MFNELPFISVIIPFRNEEIYLRGCLDSILDNNYPHNKMEIILVDGMSTDNSPEIIREYKLKFKNIFLYMNPGKTFPIAVNIGIVNSTGEFIFIMGSHAVYHRNYFTLCIETSLKYNADNSGGILNTIGLNKNFIGKAINNVLTSRFGVGNSLFRTGVKEVGEVDTVFGGCYKKSVFDKIGLFNENLTSSSDMDFNTRLRKAGGKILLNPAVVATYYTRNDFRKFLKNNFRNGYWAIIPLKYIDYIPVEFRHLVPLLFVLGIIGLIAASFFSIYFLWVILLGAFIYLCAAYYFSSHFLKDGFKYTLILPFFYFSLHVSYGLGSLFALFGVLFSKNFYRLRFNKKIKQHKFEPKK